MDKWTLQEEAFKRGYEKGKADAVVRGRWKKNPETPTLNSAFVCSVCGNVFWHHYFGDAKHYKANIWNYCPNCGAKMDGDGNG